MVAAGVVTCPTCAAFLVPNGVVKAKRDAQDTTVDCSWCPLCNAAFCRYCGTLSDKHNNESCSGKDSRFEILRTSPMKSFEHKEFPTHRCCPSCGFLIYHFAACPQVQCKCGKMFW